MTITRISISKNPIFSLNQNSLASLLIDIRIITETLLMENPIELNKNTWIDSIKIINGKQVKVHYDEPALENIGISLVDWNDISTEIKLKILKAINYHEN